MDARDNLNDFKFKGPRRVWKSDSRRLKIDYTSLYFLLTATLQHQLLKLFALLKTLVGSFCMKLQWKPDFVKFSCCRGYGLDSRPGQSFIANMTLFPATSHQETDSVGIQDYIDVLLPRSMSWSGVVPVSWADRIASRSPPTRGFRPSPIFSSLASTGKLKGRVRRQRMYRIKIFPAWSRNVAYSALLNIYHGPHESTIWHETRYHRVFEEKGQLIRASPSLGSYVWSLQNKIADVLVMKSLPRIIHTLSA